MPSSSSRCSRAAIRRSRKDGAGVGLNNGVAVVVVAVSAAEATTGRGNGGAGLAAADTAAGAAGIAVGVGWRDADTGASAAAEELSPTNAWLVPASAAMVSGRSVGAAVAAPQVTILLCCLFAGCFAEKAMTMAAAAGGGFEFFQTPAHNNPSQLGLQLRRAASPRWLEPITHLCYELVQ